MDLLIAIFCVVILVVTGCIWVKREQDAFRQRQDAFRERFPPISEAEYIALCSPGINPIVALRVRRVLSECLCVEYDQIYPSARITKDLDAQ
jgi:hypothetical protein